MQLDLTDDEAAALARLLWRTIDDDRFPMSPRLEPLKTILAKLDPRPAPAVRPPLPVGPKIVKPPRTKRSR